MRESSPSPGSLTLASKGESAATTTPGEPASAKVSSLSAAHHGEDNLGVNSAVSHTAATAAEHIRHVGEIITAVIASTLPTMVVSKINRDKGYL